MRKTFFALLMSLPMLAACPSTPSQPAATPSTPAGTPVAAPAGAPGAGSIVAGETKADATVTFGSFAFTPNEVKIKAGQSVAFVNKDQNQCRIVADDGTFDSGSFEQGKTFVQTFSKGGTYTFKHQTMTSIRGTVVVQ